MPGQSTIVQASGVLSERVGQDTALLDPASGEFTRLNATGSLLWEMLDSPTTTDALEQELVRVYSLAPAKAREDIERFVASLRDRNLLG